MNIGVFDAPEKLQKRIILLVFEGIYFVVIISEWPPLAHRLLWFWWIETWESKVMIELTGQEA